MSDIHQDEFFASFLSLRVAYKTLDAITKVSKEDGVRNLAKTSRDMCENTLKKYDKAFNKMISEDRLRKALANMNPEFTAEHLKMIDPLASAKFPVYGKNAHLSIIDLTRQGYEIVADAVLMQEKGNESCFLVVPIRVIASEADKEEHKLMNKKFVRVRDSMILRKNEVSVDREGNLCTSDSAMVLVKNCWLDLPINH